LIQSMLVNRSPLLEEMTSEALARIRADPSTAPHHSRGYFHGMHRAISTLGHAGRRERRVLALQHKSRDAQDPVPILVTGQVAEGPAGRVTRDRLQTASDGSVDPRVDQQSRPIADDDLELGIEALHRDGPI
jgi:hypothetical protein